MSRFLITMALAMLPVAAMAAPQCNGSLEAVTMDSWSIQAVNDTENRLKTSFQNDLPKSIRMIDASAGFIDALGKTVGTFSLDRDISVQAGEKFSQEGLWGPFTFERLLKLKHDEVDTFVCVRSVLYEDGSKEAFERKPEANGDQEALSALAFRLTTAYQCIPITGDRPAYDAAKEAAPAILAKAGVKEPTFAEIVTAVESQDQDGSTTLTKQLCTDLLASP